MAESKIHKELKEELAKLLNADTEVETWGGRILDVGTDAVAAEVQFKGDLNHAIENLEKSEQPIKILVVVDDKEREDAISELLHHDIYILDSELNIVLDPEN